MQKEIRQSVKCCRGFTLVELILVVGTIGMVTGALVGVIGNSTRDYEYGSDRSTLLQDGQATIDQMVRTLRQAKAFSAVTASTNQAGFITFTNADDVTEQFKLNTTTDELEYGPMASLSALTGNVSSLTFTCYDTDAVALAGAVEPASIKSVQIAMTLTSTQNTVTLASRVLWPTDRPVISPDTGPQYTYPDSENCFYTLPVAWHKLDGIDFDKFVLDSSGNGNHGILMNGPTLVDGKYGKGILFDGIDDTIELINDTGMFPTISRQITITLWVWGINRQHNFAFSGYAGDRIQDRVFSCHLPTTSDIIYWDCGLTLPAGNYDRVSKLCEDESLFNGQWNHWTFWKDVDAGIMRVYVNGTEFISESHKNKAMPQITTFRVAARADDVFFYSGIMDDFRIYDVALSEAEIADVVAGNAVGSPVLLYQFEGMATDSSGNGNHGQLQGPPVVVPGRIGSAYSFDGVDDYVAMHDFEVAGNTFTVTAWIKPDGTQKQWATIFSAHETQRANIIANVYDSSLGLHMTTTGEIRYWWNSLWPSQGFQVPADTWTFVAMVVRPDTGTLYMYDGTTLRSAVNTATHDVLTYIGAEIGDDFGVNNARQFKGLIDDVRVYDVALSEDEITALCLDWKEGAVN